MGILFTDIHTHILPGMDDGAENVEVSTQMLREMKKSGITSVIMTPHFYPHNEDPDEFSERRDNSIRELLSGIDDLSLYPDMYFGAEVSFYRGISRSNNARKLAIAGSDYILIEMPFRRWSVNEIKELATMRETVGLIPIVAHVERYSKWQGKNTLYELIDSGVFFQMNAEYILNEKTRKKAFAMICSGKIQFIASDCHNMNDRAPILDKAISSIEKNISPEFLEDFSRYTRLILRYATKVN